MIYWVISILLKGWSRTKNLYWNILFWIFQLLFHVYLLLLKKLFVALMMRLKITKFTFMFFISCFPVLVAPSSNTPESSNDVMIFLILLMSSFEINKVNRFLILTVHFPLIFVSNLFIAFEVKLLTNPGKLSLAKRFAIFVSASFS